MAFHCRCEHLESECNYPACFNGEKDKKAEVGVEARQACDPTLTQCPRCNNDIRKCDGVFVAPQPPAKCQISTDTEYYRAECEKLQAKVAELEQFKQMWAISCAERDALQAKVAILDGLSQVAIDGGWTYRGMEAYAKGLEAKVAELEKAYKDKDDAATQLVAAMRDMAGKVKEQSAEIERLTSELNVSVEQTRYLMKDQAVKFALIEELESDLVAMTECAKNHDAARTKYSIKLGDADRLIVMCRNALRSCVKYTNQFYDADLVNSALAAITERKKV